jgi:HK97 family phage major capsid protein
MGKAAALREDAIAKFKAADALVKGEDGPAAEDQAQFDALFAEGTDLMNKYRQAASAEGQVVSVREALGDLAGAVRGTGPIPFSGRQIQVDRNAGKSMGQLFVESQEYKELKASGALTSDRAAFKSSPFLAAATDIINSDPDSGGGAALVTPQYLPGVTALEQRPLSVRDLFGAGTATSDIVSYAQQTSFDKATGLAVKQSTTASDAAGLKKQSSIGWERFTSPVETIATWMAATRQQLADAGQVRSLIDNQGRLMLQLEEEEQLLNGNGTSPNLSGVYDQDIQTSSVSGLTTNGEANIDGIRNAARLVKVGLSRLTADAIVMNPTDSMYLDLSVDGESRYRIGDPFSQAAGAGPRPIWGLRRVESEAIDEGKALIGAFKVGATVLERQGITVLTADQHADFFVRNLVVILFEERLGFPVYFPSAFVDLTLDTWSNVIGS